MPSDQLNRILEHYCAQDVEALGNDMADVRLPASLNSLLELTFSRQDFTLLTLPRSINCPPILSKAGYIAAMSKFEQDVATHTKVMPNSRACVISPLIASPSDEDQ